MYFIKYHPLKTQLRNRELSDREALPYFIIFLGLTTFFMEFSSNDYMNRWNYLSGILNISITLAGLIYAYMQNGGKSGYDIIQKFVVLGWVVAVRVFIIVLLLYFTLAFLFDLFDVVNVSDNLLEVIILSAVELIYYQRLGHHIKDTNGDLSEPAGELERV